MRKQLMASGDVALNIEDEELVLLQPWKVSKEHLLAYGATHDGEFLIKRFPTSRFHATPESIETRIAIFREGCDFICGMSGYSALDQNRCAELNIRHGSYEAAVLGLMESAINRLHHVLPQVRMGLVYGSSAMGVDLAIENVAQEKNIPLLGFSCLEYLWYVNNGPVGPHICVLESTDAYCHEYVTSCNLLMASNGGHVSYQKDIIAATRSFIPILPIDVIRMLGASVPAFKPDGKTVNDAVGVLLHIFRLMRFETVQCLSGDKFTTIANAFADAVVDRAREVIGVQYAFKPLQT